MRWLLPSLVALLTLTVEREASACSCLMSDLARSTRESDHTFVGTPLRRFRQGSYVIYEVEVNEPITSCFRVGAHVLVGTPSSEPACGIRLTLGQKWLLFADDKRMGGTPRMITTLCSGDVPWSSVSNDDVAWLATRPTSCGGVLGCADGSLPVSCFADPCTVTASCDPNATCESNTCGGCTAEFYYSDDTRACWP